MTLNGSIIKISFSDNGKRRDIVGDEHGYELNEKTCKLLHISLNKNSQIPQESYLKDFFRKYGYVNGLHVKNHFSFRPSIYVEYSRPEEAENAINQLMTQDITGEKRKLIGDPTCEINYYFKKKNFNFNNASINAAYEMNSNSQNFNYNYPSNFFNNFNNQKMNNLNNAMMNATTMGNNQLNIAQLMNMNKQGFNQGNIKIIKIHRYIHNLL